LMALVTGVTGCSIEGGGQVGLAADSS
jgi:hypothetical protein